MASTPLYTLASQTWWEADGSQTVWNFSFAGGYLDRTHVKAWRRAPGETVPTPITVTADMFIGDYQLRIEPAVPATHIVAIYRDTPKIEPLVNYQDGAQVSEASLDTNARQAIFAAAETTDTLTLATLDASGITLAAVEAAAGQVVSDAITSFRNDLRSTTSGAYGAGMVGYSEGQTYSADTVGAKLQQLSLTGNSLPPVAGQAGKLLGTNGVDLIWVVATNNGVEFGVNVMNFIPQAEHAAIFNGTSTYDCTADFQAAVNAAAQTWTRKIFVPAGRFYIPPDKSVLCYYDAGTNPTYPRIRNGHLEIIGEGWDSEASGPGIPGNLCGTLIWSGAGVVRTRPFFEVSPASEDALPYFGRDFVMRDMSFDGNSAGHLVVCRGVPGARFINTQIVQRNAAGSGLEWGTGYIGSLTGCRIVNVAAGATTGNGITLRASIEAGLYSIDSETICGGYGYGLRVVSGAIQQLKIDSVQIAGKIGGILVDGAGVSSVEVLNLAGAYSEGVCQFWIKGGSEAIRVLRISGAFVYGAGFTQAAIQLDKPDAVSIDGVRVQDLAGTFMNVASLPSLSHNAMYVRNVHFYYTSPVTTLRTLFTGVIPALETIEWPEGNTNCRLHPTTHTPVRTLPLFSATSSMQVAGHFRQTHAELIAPAINGTIYYHAALGYPASVWFSNHSAGITLELKKGTTAKLGDQFRLEVINKGTGPVTVTREIGGTTITTVPAGQKTWLLWSDLFDDWS